MVKKEEYYNVDGSDKMLDGDKKNYSRTNHYGEIEEGNTAKAYEYIPDTENDDSEILEKIRRDRQQRKAREDRANRSRLRRLEKSLGIDLKACLTLIAMISVLLYFCIDYLSVSSEVTSKSKTLVNKESEVNELRTKNDSKLEDVKSSVNLQEIYETATQDLGMVFSDDNKIIKYEGNESTYVEQYEDLPEDYKKTVYEDILSALER